MQLAAVNAARGGLFALGGALTTLGGADTEYVFGFSVAIGNPDVRQLAIGTSAVPEPGVLLLLAPAIAIAFRRRARR